MAPVSGACVMGIRPNCSSVLAHKIRSSSQVPTDLSSIHQLIPRQFTGSSMSLLQVPPTQTAYGSRAFSVAVPNIWNKLPGNVLAVNCLNVFRRRLKTVQDTSFHCRFRRQVTSVMQLAPPYLSLA